jgi:hypothetical protein
MRLIVLEPRGGPLTSRVNSAVFLQINWCGISNVEVSKNQLPALTLQIPVTHQCRYTLKQNIPRNQGYIFARTMCFSGLQNSFVMPKKMAMQINR